MEKEVKKVKKEKKENNLVLLLQRKIYSPKLIREIIKNSISFDDFFNKVNIMTNDQINQLPSENNENNGNNQNIIEEFNKLNVSSV